LTYGRNTIHSVVIEELESLIVVMDRTTRW